MNGVRRTPYLSVQIDTRQNKLGEPKNVSRAISIRHFGRGLCARSHRLDMGLAFSPASPGQFPIGHFWSFQVWVGGKSPWSFAFWVGDLPQTRATLDGGSLTACRSQGVWSLELSTRPNKQLRSVCSPTGTVHCRSRVIEGGASTD